MRRESMGETAADAPLITTTTELEKFLAHVRDCGRVAFDTEFVSEDTYEPVLCLVQVATRDRLANIDPLSFRDLDAFWDVVTDPAVEVVMHAAGEDLRICRLQTGKLPARVFDVQIAAGLVGFGFPLSLSNLAHQTLGVSLFGGETRTDWRRRPLSAAQLRYAVDDVRYLLPMADKIGGMLRELGRESWAEEEFRDFLSTVQSRDNESRWRRLPGLHQLSRRGLEAARLLTEWRAEEARRQNRPLRQVIRDDLLVAIAKRQPSNRQELEALRDFNRPQLLSKSQDVLSRIGAAQAVPDHQLPEHGERHEEGPGLTMMVNLLSATLAHCCSQKKIAVGMVGTASDLKEMIRWDALKRPESHRPHLASGWRDGVCGETLLDVLAGRRSLRVIDPQSDVPVAVEPIADSNANPLFPRLE